MFTIYKGELFTMLYNNYDYYTICNRIEKTANKTLALAISMLGEMNDRLRAVNVSSEKPKTTAKPRSVHKRMKLSPPWNTVWSMLVVLFKGDDEITVKAIQHDDSGVYTITLESPNATKVCALSRLLKGAYSFGNVTLKIKYAVTNNGKVAEDYDKNDLYDVAIEAFVSTPAVVDIKHCQDLTGSKFVVIEFAKEVVQFYNDELFDFYGNWNGTYIDVAKQLCTDIDGLMFTISESE